MSHYDFLPAAQRRVVNLFAHVHNTRERYNYLHGVVLAPEELAHALGPGPVTPAQAYAILADHPTYGTLILKGLKA